MKRYTLAIGIVSGLAGILTFASPAAALTPRGCSGALAAGSAPAFKITGTGIGVKLRGEPLTNTSNWEKGISDGASFRLLAQTSGDATGPRANTVWDFVQLADGRQGYIADAWATTPGVANQYYNAVPRCGTATAPAAPAAAAPPAAQPKKWVAMGDSYSSGEGNAPFDNGTATSTDECHRSPNAWARLAASAGGYQMLHIACSGAVLDDVKYGKSTEKSQIDQLGSLPGGAASLVTITIGGNDMGFSTILGSCRFYVACLTNLPSNQATADNISSRLVSDLIPKIKAKAPNAKIVLVGYPRLFPLNQASTKELRLADGHEALTAEFALILFG
jgi:lysophospholipase L1-like esterase